MQSSRYESFVSQWQRLLGDVPAIHEDAMVLPSELDMQLKKLVDLRSASVYLTADELKSELVELGVNDTTIYKLCMLTTVTSFSDVVAQGNEVRQVDINRLIVNAQNETGLNRLELMNLIHAVLWSLGTALDYDSHIKASAEKPAPTAFAVPYRLYLDDIMLIQQGIEIAQENGTKVTDVVINTLEPLIAAGIPKAKYFMGYCMLNGLLDDKAEEKGLELLAEAESAGDVDAAAELGDYYFSLGEKDMLSTGWEKALEYYTGFGSLALNENRKANVNRILNHGLFNKRTLSLCILLIIAMILVIVFSLGSPVYAGHTPLGVLDVVLCVAIFVFGKMAYKTFPYFSNYVFPVTMFMVWTLYMSIRFIFY